VHERDRPWGHCGSFRRGRQGRGERSEVVPAGRARWSAPVRRRALRPALGSAAAPGVGTVAGVAARPPQG
jgi:hypothetical protein